MGILDRWRAERLERRRAAAFVDAASTEPADADVRWLAEHGTGGDVDHARWELRYARLAMALVTAEQDALDDRTASLVAHELERSFARDPRVAADRREIARRQFNARLRTYGDAVRNRERRLATRDRLAHALFDFAGTTHPPSDAAIVRGGDLLAGYLLEANAALREAFGSASLPEDLPPSALASRR